MQPPRPPYKPKIQQRVVITPDNQYLRYETRALTNHIISETPLTARQVDMYRRYPTSFIRQYVDPYFPYEDPEPPWVA